MLAEDQMDAPARVADADRAPPRPAPTPLARRRARRRALLFALLPVALLAGGYEYVTGGAIVSTDNAYVQAEQAGVTTDVSGLVASIAVHDNERVRAGQVLFRLDPAPFRLARDRAAAELATVRDDVLAMQATYRDLEAQIVQAGNDVAYAGREFQRQDALAAVHAASQQALDTARRNWQQAQQTLESLRQKLAGVAAGLGGDPAAPVERNPRYLAALAQRDEAQRQLDHATVRAPFAGIVTKVPALAVGSYLAAAQTAFYLVSADHVWVEANPKETQLTDVRPGQAVTVTADTYPGATWHGTVASISPAAAQTFSLLPAQNASGNWVKVVQRIPLEVKVDTADAALPRLRAGMSVVVDIDTGHPRGLPGFLRGWFGQGR